MSYPRLLSWLMRAREDPIYFAGAFCDPLGRPLRMGTLHRELQLFLTHHRRALVELPRDHGKSVQMCIRLLWELGRQPGLRIKIVSATTGLAAERGRFLRDCIEQNPLLKMIFPKLLPAKPWEATSFTVARPSQIVGPSVASLGIGAASTGARADLLVCDDIVDVKSLHSAAERQRVARHFRENLVNLLEPDGRLWCTFTPWHEADLNAELKKSPAYALFRRAIDDELEPIWPEHWSRERLEERRAEIGEVAFARAYRLTCIADGDTVIRPEWIGRWHVPSEYETTIIAIDPAATASEKSDATAIVVLGRTAERIVECLEALAVRLPAPELIQRIDALDEQWHPDAIVFEANAAFVALHDVMKAHAAFGPKLKSVKQSKSKASRIESLGVHLAAGRVLVHDRQLELIRQLTTFPFVNHDDLADALALGSAYLLDRREPRMF